MIPNGARDTTCNGNGIVIIGEEESNRTHRVIAGLKGASEEKLAVDTRKVVKDELSAKKILVF